MIKFLLLIGMFSLISCFNFVQFASFIPILKIDNNNQEQIPITSIQTSGVVESNKQSEEVMITRAPIISSTPLLLTTKPNQQQQQNQSVTSIVTINSQTTPTTTPFSTTTILDSEDDIGGVLTTQPNNNSPVTVTVSTNTDRPTEDNNKIVNLNKPLTSTLNTSDQNENIKLNVLFYSVFIVYVSFIKLIYHNVAIIKRNLTEPGQVYKSNQSM